MAFKALVLGCGMVGRTMALDLAADESFDVTAVDLNPGNLERLGEHPRLTTRRTDLSDTTNLASLAGPYDIVLGALPSRIGYQALTCLLQQGKKIADISFIPEDALQLNDLAKQHGGVAIVDCGVSPGLSNLFVGHAHASFDESLRAVIYVGGLPKTRQWPFDYKAPFAPSDVIEEYTRPARLVENGLIVTRPALSEPELLDFDGVGTLEACNTDGLRSLLDTVDIPDMREKTLRYPGHIELMRIFRETGLFDTTAMNLNGVQVTPREVTSKLLFKRWEFLPGEEEFTILRVMVDGMQNGERMTYTYDLYDEYDRVTATQSMARTTAFPNAIVARMLARGEISEPGVFAPESLATDPHIYDRILEELGKRNVSIKQALAPTANP